MSYKFYPQLGSKCHQRAQAQVPICVVTTLDHTQLLFAHVPVGSGGSTWVVQSASCSVQRFWNSSTATIKVTCEALEPNYFAPPLPLISNPEDNIIHPIGPEDNICIWMGYVDSLFTKGEDLIKLMEGDKPNLMRVFVGVVDTVGLTGTDAGFNYTFQCRDRVRYLMETAVSLSPFDLKNDREYMNLALGGTNSVVARSEMILRLAQLGIGHVQLGKDEKEVKVINGLRIDRGLIKDLGEITKAENTSIVSADFGSKVAMPPADYFYNYDKRPLAADTKTKTLDLSPHPKFNIITSRLPFSTESVAKEYTIEQQIPIDIIKWLSNQEAYPTEVFSSHQDGDLYYVPRASDLSGLADPKRFYRTYYYRYQPPGLGEAQTLDPMAKTYPNVKIDSGLAPDAAKLELDFTAPFRQMPDWAVGIINWREEFTTNAMFTNYLIANNAPNSTKDGNVTLMSMAARPPFLAGRSIAGRNKYIIDETINNRQEAIAVGVQMARIHSKETRTAAMTILGDPSLIPGEIVQVVGSPLHRELGTLEALIAERFGLVDYLKREHIAYDDALTKIKGYDKDNEKVQAVNGGDKVDSPGNQFQSLKDKPNATIGGTSIAGALGGSPVALGACTQKDRGSIIQEGIPSNTKLPTSVPVKSASSDGTAANTTPAAPTGIGTGGSSTTASQSGMVYPLQVGGPVTSVVGYRDIGPIGSKNHGGTDIAVPTGTVVVAALGGKVTIAQKGFGKLGQAIRIEHGNNLATRYGHLHTTTVAVGQEVATGQAIGTSGGGGGDPYELRGSSTGDHLHFEVRENDKTVPPTYMIFSYGSTPSKDAIANRLKVVGAAASSATPTPAATTPAVPATQVPATKEEGKPAAKPAAYRKQVILKPTSRQDSNGTKILELKLYDSNGNPVFSGDVTPTLKTQKEFTQLKSTTQPFLSTYRIEVQFWSQPDDTANRGKYNFTLIDPGYIFSLYATIKAEKKPAEPGFVFINYADLDKFYTAYKKVEPATLSLVGSDGTVVNSGAQTDNAQATTAAGEAANAPTTPAPTEFKVDKYEDYPDEAWKKSHFSQEPQSLFRVDAVRHDFNAVGRSLGYSVEVVLMPITG
jgi:murein DD-endopeptidase MepM/ murein hydrolase activator NlpD